MRCPRESSRDSCEVLSLAAWASSEPSLWGSVAAAPGCHWATGSLLLARGGGGGSEGVGGAMREGLFSERLFWGSRHAWPMAEPSPLDVARDDPEQVMPRFSKKSMRRYGGKCTSSPPSGPGGGGRGVEVSGEGR